MKSQRVLIQSLAAAAAVAALPALAAAAMTPAQDVQATFQSAKVTLAQAIATVEKQTAGKVTNAAFQTQSGKSGYIVTAYAGGKMQALWVDPQTGMATAVAKPSTDEAAIETQDQADEPTLNGAKATLAQAVAMAEQKAGGKAFDAGLQKHATKVAISVDVLKDGKLSTFWVDPAAGKLES